MMQSTNQVSARIDAAHYIERRDGKLEQFLKDCSLQNREPLFLGVAQYHQLWDEGLLEPELTSVRIMYSHGRHDEHYFVCDRETLIGMTGQAHSGHEGVHSVQGIIPESGTMFSIYMWHRK